MRPDSLKFDIEPAVSEENPATTVMPGEVVIGTVVDVNDNGIPQVDYPGNPANSLLDAMTTVPVNKESVGRQAALLFQNGDPGKPLIVGLVRNFLDELPVPAGLVPTDDNQPQEVLVDGERIVFTAEKEIVLKCGKASIILTKAGKVLIRGAYLSNRSSGVNRIKGGSVQIN